MSENRLLWRIFAPMREEVAEAGEDYITRSFTTYYKGNQT
jgi:hypothetical protein